MSDSTGSKTDLGTGGNNGNKGSGTGELAVINLASDQAGEAANLGPSMGNSWGIVGFQGDFWIANEATGAVTIVDGSGKLANGKISSGSIELGEGITGVTVNDMASDKNLFQMHKDTKCEPAQLIFASAKGLLIGVNPDLSTTEGFTLVDRSQAGAIYLGVALLHTSNGPLVLAADFHNGNVDVFDASFTLVTSVSFVDRDIPAGFAPFNVMVFNDKVFVAFAQQDENKEEEVTGPGLGFIAVFDASGTLLNTIESDLFNAPWGMAQTCNFAQFPNALLVGNFGDGRITAIDLTGMTVLGQLMSGDTAISVDGLWGITFGTGVDKARADGLYFAAGPDDEAHGLFGVIAPAR
jgi:uncharacterized protein (TIGR03118 family)